MENKYRNVSDDFLKDILGDVRVKIDEAVYQRTLKYLVAEKGYTSIESAACFYSHLDAHSQHMIDEQARHWEEDQKAKKEAKEVEKSEEDAQSNKLAERKRNYQMFLPKIPVRYRDADITTFKGQAKDHIIDKGLSCILGGSNGTGKTYFAWAVMKYLKENTDKEALLCKAVRLLSSIKAHISTEADIFQYIEDVYGKALDVLIIDECDKIFGSTSDYIYLTHLIDYRYEWGLQTIMIGNVTEDDIKFTLGSSVLSRLAGKADGGRFFVKTGEDRRMVVTK